MVRDQSRNECANCLREFVEKSKILGLFRRIKVSCVGHAQVRNVLVFVGHDSSENCW